MFAEVVHHQPARRGSANWAITIGAFQRAAPFELQSYYRSAELEERRGRRIVELENHGKSAICVALPGLGGRHRGQSSLELRSTV